MVKLMHLLNAQCGQDIEGGIDQKVHLQEAEYRLDESAKVRIDMILRSYSAIKPS